MTTGYCILFRADLLWKMTFITMAADGDVRVIGASLAAGSFSDRGTIADRR